jgi:hypothetical protein
VIAEQIVAVIPTAQSEHVPVVRKPREGRSSKAWPLRLDAAARAPGTGRRGGVPGRPTTSIQRSKLSGGQFFEMSDSCPADHDGGPNPQRFKNATVSCTQACGFSICSMWPVPGTKL